MARESKSTTIQQLQLVRDSVEVWRRTRLKRSPMPERLWAQATELAQCLGVWPVARDLRLCYESLKRRVDGKTGHKQASATPFVEMRVGDLMEVAKTDGVVVELHSTDGTRMTVRLGGSTAVDMAALVGAFRWRRK